MFSLSSRRPQFRAPRAAIKIVYYAIHCCRKKKQREKHFTITFTLKLIFNSADGLMDQRRIRTRAAVNLTVKSEQKAAENLRQSDVNWLDICEWTIVGASFVALTPNYEFINFNSFVCLSIVARE